MSSTHCWSSQYDGLQDTHPRGQPWSSKQSQLFKSTESESVYYNSRFFHRCRPLNDHIHTSLVPSSSIVDLLRQSRRRRRSKSVLIIFEMSSEEGKNTSMDHSGSPGTVFRFSLKPGNELNARTLHKVFNDFVFGPIIIHRKNSSGQLIQLLVSRCMNWKTRPPDRFVKIDPSSSLKFRKETEFQLFRIGELATALLIFLQSERTRKMERKFGWRKSHSSAFSWWLPTHMNASAWWFLSFSLFLR